MSGGAEGGGQAAIGRDDRVVLLHMGGLGDLVLAADILAAIRAARPAAHVTLVCRAELRALAEMLPAPPGRLVGLSFDPHLWDGPSEALAAGLGTVAAALRDVRAEVLIDATLRAGWFGTVVAALIEPRAALACRADADPGQAPMGRLASAQLGLAPKPVTAVPIPPRRHERERYRRLIEACGLAPPPDADWVVPAARRAEARAVLAREGLQPGAFLACCPGGAAATRLKRWPEAHFRSVLAAAGMPALLLGSAADGDAIERLAAAVPAARLVTGEAELPLAAAVLAEAGAWIGNDSGLMHLAQAFAVPGVAIFGGGGRWPSYAPWARGTVGLVHPLPCFGCDWDCMLGHALCVESVPPAAAIAALRRVAASPHAPPAVVAVDEVAAPVRAVLADVGQAYQALQRDRAARLAAILGGEAERREKAGLSAAAEPGPARCRAVHIANGLGAGNIGDEIMARGFWGLLPDTIALDVPLLPEARRHRAPYPARHRYLDVIYDGDETAAADLPGLLVGTTPVAEDEGLHFPLHFVARRLRAFHARGLPVDAVGVGVEPLLGAAAQEVFHDAFAPIRSWTVRAEASRTALLALGVPDRRIKVGADWAWLHTPGRDRRRWAEEHWRRHGIDPARPLLVANVVNMQWAGAAAAKSALAAALARAAARYRLQIAFLANESRDGDFFDAAAARQMAGSLGRPAVVLPNAYFAADEAVALLSFATVTVGQRYHFVVESVLAGTVPIAIPRGAKMRELAADLGIAAIGSVESLAARPLLRAIGAAIGNRPALLLHLAARRRDLAARAAGNLDLIRALPPYESVWPKAP